MKGKFEKQIHLILFLCTLKRKKYFWAYVKLHGESSQVKMLF